MPKACRWRGWKGSDRMVVTGVASPCTLTDALVCVSEGIAQSDCSILTAGQSNYALAHTIDVSPHTAEADSDAQPGSLQVVRAPDPLLCGPAAFSALVCQLQQHSVTPAAVLVGSVRVRV